MRNGPGKRHDAALRGRTGRHGAEAMGAMREHQRVERDEEQVDLEMTFARMYWRHRLRVDDAMLKRAVREAGPYLSDVCYYLATHSAAHSPRHHAEHEAGARYAA
jgi:hypothetical protein